MRVCDGYYFPLTFAASRQRLATDAMKCMDQYGQGEATLYYYPNPGGDASQAVSLAGERYADQPYAFLFRRAFKPQCAGRLHAGLTTLGQRALGRLETPGEKFKKAMAALVETPSDLIPIVRADWASDPETLFNRAGGLVPAPIGATREAVVVARDNIRRVGDGNNLSDASPGPPSTVAGYTPPELRDYRTGMLRRGGRVQEAERRR